MLINLEHLLRERLLKPGQFPEKLSENKLSQESGLKYELLREAFRVFQSRMEEQKETNRSEKAVFQTLKDVGPREEEAGEKYLSWPNYLRFWKENATWLDDYVLFKALKNYFGNVPWYEWEQGIATRNEESIAGYSLLLAEEIEFNRFIQYTFFYQWQAIRQYARNKDVKLIGDIPLFVAADSCDVWVNRGYFALEKNGEPAKVAGVPPDYFSETGQLWGNPLYNWQALASDNYSWWKERIRLTLRLYDYIRIDHFRGLEAYWEIEAGAETAAGGRWMKGPGKRFLESLCFEFGNLPFIAEDLGFITPEVNILKRIFGLPGMKILQFTPLAEGLAEKDNNLVYYSGTHDNDTLLGWLKAQKQISGESDKDDLRKKTENIIEKESKIIDSQDKNQQKINNNSDNIGRYSAEDREDTALKMVCRKLMEDLYLSPAAWVILPIQDILGLDTDARMNLPGTVGGKNWQWQMNKALLTDEVKIWLRTLAVKSGRSP
jgi:4-alpha-glucanotransferase